MKTVLFVLLVSAVLLCSCDSFDRHFPRNTMYERLDSLRKGMHQTEVRRILGRELERDTLIDLTVGDRTYRVERYWLTSTRRRVEWTHMGATTWSGTPGSFRQEPSTVTEVLSEVQVPMLALYDDGALRYWGTLEDYWQTEDREVIEIARSLETEFLRGR